MKKLFLLSLGLVLGLAAYAQVRTSKDAKNIQLNAQRPSAERVIDGSAVPGMQFNMPQSVVSSTTREEGEDYTEYEAMITNYDLQSNSALGSRVVAWPDGTAAFTATWDHSNNSNWPDRGTGYNYFNGEDIGDMPEARVEGTLKTGWPSIAAIGDGEILASHGGSPTATHIYKRDTKGEGAWTEKATIANLQWPRIGVTGENHEYVHVVGARQEGNSTIGYTNFLMWARSTDGGETFSEATEIPTEIIDNTKTGMYQNLLSADDYVVATNGNTIAILYGTYYSEVFYIISRDNGETWEKQVVAPWIEEGDIHAHVWDSFPSGVPNKLVTEDNSHSIAIDDDGVVHVVFGLFRWRQTNADHYTYWPCYNYGIVYWNSEYENEQGGHEIPLLGNWSGDAMFAEEFGDTLSYSLAIERLDTLCRVDGGEHLWYFGYPVEIDEETGDTCYYQSAHFLNTTWHYRSFGCATLPGISVDNLGNIAVCYNVLSAKRINEANDFYFRNAYVSYKPVGEPWHDDEINLTESFEHSVEEAYATTAAQRAYDGVFYMMYNCDEEQGLYLDIDPETYPNSNGGGITENKMMAIRLTPQGLGIHENEAVNPMTTLRAYPNPTTDIINLEINASMRSDMNVSIYTITGQKVMSKTVSVGTGINTTQINVNELESGVYFCSVSANGFNRTVKIIVK